MAHSKMAKFEFNMNIDYAEVQQCIEDSDPRDINIEQYFTDEELAKISEYERKRLRNMKQNYEMLIKFGLPGKKPDFMLRKYESRRKKKPEPDSDEGDDVEWTPALERARSQPARPKWVPPKMPKVRTRSASQKKHVTFGKTAQQIRPSAAFSRLDQLVGPQEPKKVFTGFNSPEDKAMTKKLKNRAAKLGKLIAKLEADEIDVTEAQLKEPTDFYSKRKITAMVKQVESTRKPKPSKRYPRRSIAKKDYSELEVPDEDHFLYCDDCEAEHLGDCPVHGPLIIVEDTKVTPEDLAKSGIDHAHMTLPDSVEIRRSRIPRAGDGAWTKTDVPKGVRFGPYIGKLIKSEDAAQVSGYCWQIDRPGKDDHFIDAHSKDASNWMRYVNCARVESEQNLVAFQYRGQIYYRSIQDIPAETELLVWYGDQYGAELGIAKESFYEAMDKTEVPVAAQASSTGNSTQPPDSVFLKPLPVHTKPTPSERAPVVPDPTGTFQCRMCHDKFLTEKNLRGHVCSAAAECGAVTSGRGECVCCGGSFSHLKLHMQIHTGEKLHKCTECGYTCILSGNMKTHMRIHTGEKPYECTLCEYRSARAQQLKDHMSKHTGEKPYKCTQCSFSCVMSCNLKSHMRTHTGEKPHECTLCEYRSIMPQQLKSHMSKHTGEKPHKCTQCSYSCTLSGNMKIHMRTHTGEKPYKCTQCSFSCIQSGTLKRHMRTHTGEKPYKCTQCTYSCVQSVNMERHMRTHTGEKPYKCTQCSYSCIRSSDLKSHMRTHTGEKPYKCTQCDFSCTTSSTLKNHCRAKH